MVDNSEIPVPTDITSSKQDKNLSEVPFFAKYGDPGDYNGWVNRHGEFAMNPNKMTALNLPTIYFTNIAREEGDEVIKHGVRVERRKYKPDLQSNELIDAVELYLDGSMVGDDNSLALWSLAALDRFSNKGQVVADIASASSTNEKIQVANGIIDQLKQDLEDGLSKQDKPI